MAWENFDEWTQGCDEKIKNIKNDCAFILKDDTYFILSYCAHRANLIINHDPIVKSFMRFVQYTLQRYNNLILSNDVDNQIKKIKKYSEFTEKVEAKKFHNFIDYAWEQYKNIKYESKNRLRKFNKNVAEITKSSNNDTGENKQLNDNMTKLENSYSNNLKQLSIKLKSEIQKLKKFGEERGVVRVQKLQRLILSSKRDFGLLHYLQTSLNVIKEQVEKISKEFVVKKNKMIPNNPCAKTEALVGSYLSTAEEILCKDESKLRFKIKEVENFFDNESNFIDLNDLKKNSRYEQYYEQLNVFIKFIEKELTEIIEKYIDASTKFAENQFKENTKNEKLNSEMKHVFRYILKKINSFCSNKKKEFKKKQKENSNSIVISDTTMNEIMDLLKAIAISNYFNEDKITPDLNKLQIASKVIGGLSGSICGVAIIIGGSLATSGVSATLTEMGFFITLLSSICVPLAIGFGIAAIGPFFYLTFKEFKHRKIKNKFKKFLKNKEKNNLKKNNGQGGNLPPAPTVTPMHGPETPY